MTIAPASRLPRSRSGQDLHVPSHRSLALSGEATGPAAGRGSTPDQYPQAVVVPATRTNGTLRHAAGVARMSICPLLIICSKELTPEMALAELAGVALPPWVLAVRLDDQHAIRALNLKTSRFNNVTDQRCDTSDKRNLAILAARRLGWDRILFLDDDVTGLGRVELDRMARLMAQETGDGKPIEAVGWAFTATNENATDDNSVVCHAYRSTGAHQDTFIGAGGLMVRCGTGVPFFPKIYNEDWLFLLPLLTQRRVVLAGELTQSAFDPFRDPRRAGREEFGDLLAEGLYSLLHHPWGDDVLGDVLGLGADPHWWAETIDRRRSFVDHILTRLRAERRGRSAMVESLQNSRGALRNSWSDLLAEFVVAWEADLTTWQARVRAVEPVPVAFDRHSLEPVFADLGMSGATWLYREPHREEGRRTNRT